MRFAQFRAFLAVTTSLAPSLVAHGYFVGAERAGKALFFGYDTWKHCRGGFWQFRIRFSDTLIWSNGQDVQVIRVPIWTHGYFGVEKLRTFRPAMSRWFEHLFSSMG